MSVIINTQSRTEEEIEECDYRDAISIKKDGETIFNVFDDEPEDSNLGRSFTDCYNVHDLLKMAYEAGKNGEEWEFNEELTSDI